VADEDLDEMIYPIKDNLSSLRSNLITDLTIPVVNEEFWTLLLGNQAE
jgi:hypothetical protein